DHDDMLIAARDALAARAAVVDAAPGQLVDPGRLEAAVVDAGRDDDRLRPELVVARHLHEPGRAALVDLRHLLDGQELGAEALRLRRRPPGQVGPGEPDREAQVVLDPRALAGLAAGRLALDERGAQALGGAVD